MRLRLLLISLGVAVSAAVGCNDQPSITTEPAGALGFGTILTKTSTNLPRGQVTFPVSITGTAAAPTESLIVTLAGLDSLATGTYTLWFANDSSTKFSRVTSFNLVTTRVDSTLNAAGDPVFNSVVNERRGIDGFRIGGSNYALRLAMARAGSTALVSGDSLTTLLISIETAAPGATPSDVRPLWARRSQANASRVAPVQFGAFGRALSTTPASPTAGQEYVLASNGVLPIIPRGRVEVRGNVLIVNDSNYYRPPAGYFYNAYGVILDTLGRFRDTVYLGARTSPYPARASLFDADRSNPAPDVVLDRPRVILAMATRVSADSLATSGAAQNWFGLGFVRINLQSKYAREGVMGPNTVLEGIVPPSVRGR